MSQLTLAKEKIMMICMSFSNFPLFSLLNGWKLGRYCLDFLIFSNLNVFVKFEN